MADKPNVPVCETAELIADFAARLRHYRNCQDPRCRERMRVARIVGRTMSVTRIVSEQQRAGDTGGGGG